MNAERLQELAALNAGGALDAPDTAELRELLATGDATVKREVESSEMSPRQSRWHSR